MRVIYVYGGGCVESREAIVREMQSVISGVVVNHIEELGDWEDLDSSVKRNIPIIVREEHCPDDETKRVKRKRKCNRWK